MGVIIFVVVLVALVTPIFGNDPDMLQDTCVADYYAPVAVNGFPCKKSSKIKASDFFFNGLSEPGSTNNTMGSAAIAANVEKIPGLNTLGISMARLDLAPGGLIPPHTHPRASEMIFVLSGQLDVFFITTSNKLIYKRIYAGNCFVFPKALVHFLKNNGRKYASVISAFNSQLPGAQLIAATLFTSHPPVPNDILGQTFRVGNKVVNKIKARLTPTKK